MDQYIVPFPDATDPALLVCGGSNVAVTYPENNLICFCPAQFNVITTFAELPKQPTLDPLSPDMMDAFRTISGSFLHEYTHLIRSAADSFAWSVHITKRSNEIPCFKALGMSP
jgi:hypothetical protein